jgi:hypothetical protein
MPSARDILWVVALPTVLAALAMLTTRPWRGRRAEAERRTGGGWAAAIAIAGGFAVAFIGLFLTPNGKFMSPQFPPGSGEQWVLLLTIPIVLIALMQAFVKSKWSGIAGSVALLLVTPYLVRRSQHAYVDPREFWTWTIGAALVMAAWWLAMEPLARRVRGASVPALLGIWAGVCALAIIDAGVQSLGMVTGSIAITSFVVAAAAWWSRGAPLARGGMLALALLVPAMLLCAYFFAELKIRDLALLVIAPLAMWAGELPALGASNSWRRVIVRSVAVLAVLGLTAVTSIAGLKKTMDEQIHSYEY